MILLRFLLATVITFVLVYDTQKGGTKEEIARRGHSIHEKHLVTKKTSWLF